MQLKNQSLFLGFLESILPVTVNSSPCCDQIVAVNIDCGKQDETIISSTTFSHCFNSVADSVDCLFKVLSFWFLNHGQDFDSEFFKGDESVVILIRLTVFNTMQELFHFKNVTDVDLKNCFFSFRDQTDYTHFGLAI